MRRIKQYSICITIVLLTSLTGMSILAQSLAPNQLSDADKCGNNNPGEIFSPDAVIQACSAVINTPYQIPIFRENALFSRGIAYAELNDHQRAIADFSELIRRHPKHNSYYYYERRAEIYKRLGSYDLAIADFSRALRERANTGQASTAGVYFERGDIYNIRQQYDKAIGDFTKGIRESPFADLYEGRCLSYVMKGKYDLALSDCNEAIRLSPTPEAVELRAKIYLTTGKTGLATADLDLAVRLKAAAAAQAKVSPQEWRLASSVVEREVSRATGYFVTTHGSRVCSAIVISSAHVLTDGCENLSHPVVREENVRLAMGMKYPFDDAESYYEFDRTPVERAEFWAIHSVHGGQQKDYWAVRLATERPTPGQPIFELGDNVGAGRVIRGGCRVGDWQTGPRTFLYTCGNREGKRGDSGNTTKFLFSLDGTLVGVAIPWERSVPAELRPNGYLSAISVSAIRGESKILSTQAADDREVTNKVIACYKAGNATVADMYACAGVWVTPRILTLCFLDADCPVIADDTVNARSVVDAGLGGPGKLDTKLSIDMKNVLSLPDRKIIEECKGAGETAATDCVEPKMIRGPFKPLMDCAAIRDDKDRARCLTKGAPKELSSVVECLSTKGTSSAAFTECSADLPWDKVQDVQKCVSGAAENAKINCLLAGADTTQRALAACLSKSSDQAAGALDCLSIANPQMGEKIAVVTCATKATDTKAAESCFTKVMGGDGAKIAACATGGKDKMVSCLLGDKPEYKAASQVVACVQGNRGASSLVANCSDFLVKDQKTRTVLACATQAGSDSSRLAGCAASSVLPPEVARYAVCATTSRGPTSFALCAAGPMMNEEWRIAAECAVQTR